MHSDLSYKIDMGKAMDQEDIVSKVTEMVLPFLSNSGIELVEMTYRREQSGMTLRLLVDTPRGILIEECESVNACLSDMLDKDDIIGEHYVIEVSSPGLDRPIKSYSDFKRSIGKELVVTTYGPIDGSRTHTGSLIGMDADKIALEAGGVSIVIPHDKIAMAKLKIEF